MQSPEARPPMMLHPVFVAGVLEGFEGTLDEMIGRVANPELNSQLDALRSRAAAIRISIEEPLRAGGSGPDYPFWKLNLWAALVRPAAAGTTFQHLLPLTRVLRDHPAVARKGCCTNPLARDPDDAHLHDAS